MRRLGREPLLHFLVLGAAIFAAYTLVSRNIGDVPGKIVISQGQIAALVHGFTATRQRPPTEEELEGLIRDQEREEVYYREALALGLDKDDLVIRRRLRQKMEFLTDDVLAQTQPTDEELAQYLQAHPDAFRVAPSFTFRQLYLNPETRGEHVRHDAEQLLAKLNQAGDNIDPTGLGDPLMLDSRFDALPAGEVGKLFGQAFVAKLNELATGRWQGPVESGYGLHLVFVSRRTEGRAPELAEVRDAVIREWAAARRLEANEKHYEEMRERYTITVERPQTAPEKPGLAAAR